MQTDLTREQAERAAELEAEGYSWAEIRAIMGLNCVMAKVGKAIRMLQHGEYDQTGR